MGESTEKAPRPLDVAPLTTADARMILGRLYQLEQRVKELEVRGGASASKTLSSLTRTTPTPAVAPQAPSSAPGQPGATRLPDSSPIPSVPARSTPTGLPGHLTSPTGSGQQPVAPPAASPSPPRVGPSSPAPEASRSAAPAPKPAKTYLSPADFQSEEEQQRGTEAGQESSWKRSSSEGWEVALATRVLPVFGGVLLLVGAAIGATLIEGAFAPLLRVALGYVCAGLLAGAGWFALKRSTPVGHATIACALALGYFTSFAAHFIAPMRVFPLPVSLGAMAAFAVGLVLLADRWRSQPMAAIGLLLGVIGALVSAPVAETFALVSLAGLAAAAGGLFLRREWMALTAAAAALVYVALLILWVVAPVPHVIGPVLAHLGALVGIHLIFTAAFVRWGRAWKAREQALHEATREGLIPEVKSQALPFASGFNVINSLGVTALSILLLWETQVFWPHVHWLLFALMGAESLRVGVRRLRGYWEQPFHATMAFTLLSCGIVSLFSGLAESAVLAGAALAAAIAASRAPALRVIRPLGALAAALAAAAYFSELPVVFAGAGFLDHFAGLIPPLFLLASALPWERIWRDEGTLPHVLLRAAEVLSAPFRALLAASMVMAYVVDGPFSRDTITLLLAAASIALAVGIAFVSARTWCLGLGSLAAACVLSTSVHPISNSMQAAVVLVTITVLLLLTEAWRKTPARVARYAMAAFGALLALMFCAATLYALEVMEEWHGAAMWLIGLLLGGTALALWRSKPFPSLAREPLETADGSPLRPHISASPAMIGAAMFAVVGAVIACLMDAEENLLSPILIAVTLLPATLPPLARRLPGAIRPLGAMLATIFFSIGWLIHEDGAIEAGLVLAIVAVVFALGSFILRDRSLLPSVLAAGVFALIGVLFPLIAITEGAAAINRPQAIQALMAMLTVGAALLLPVLSKNRFEDSSDVPEFWEVLGSSAAHHMLGACGLGLTLAVIASTPLLPPLMITPAWGVLGALVLAGGLILADRMMRYCALGIFVLAVGRVFLVDAVGLDPVTRAVAFFGLGLLLVAGGIAYGLACRRLVASSEQTHDEES